MKIENNLIWIMVRVKLWSIVEAIGPKVIELGCCGDRGMPVTTNAKEGGTQKEVSS